MSERKRPCPAGAQTVLLVEGGDEERLCRALLPSTASAWVIVVGRTALAPTLGGLLKELAWPHIRNVGLVLDAEDDVSASHTLARSCFELLGRPVPGRAGSVTHTKSGNDGWFLLPDNVSVGANESLLRRTAPARIAACIDSLFACTPNPGSTAARRDKAWVNAWLSAARGEGRVDQAWGPPDAVNAGHPAFDDLRSFLAALVETDPLPPR